ncbi:NYN domain-containing protein [Candidatus Woesearchaeota archaeon]|jgi:uncharacterized LabA/DUF88 family protein|nr:NYN domain-containing protein [Candidatus Woesearchaeota archaeon]
MKHKEQRILVLFDVQNMYYSAKQLYHKKVNFSNILSQAVSNRKLTRAIAYVIKTDIKEEVNFHDALNKIGIEVKAKDIQIFLGGAKKGDWDIGIAMDAVRLSPKVDVVVLVSGDGDFKDLLQYLQSHGCRGEVIAFGKTASKHLKETADDFHDLEKNPAKYLIGYKGGYNQNNNHNNNKKGNFQKKDFKHQKQNYKPTTPGMLRATSNVQQTGPSAQVLPKINLSDGKKAVPNVNAKPEVKVIPKQEARPITKPVVKVISKPAVKTETTKTKPAKTKKKTTTKAVKPAEKPKPAKKQGLVKKFASKFKKK